MKALLITTLALVLLGGMGADTAQAVSQAGGISLQFPIGARYNALGEAGTALSTDMTAIWWNPGGFAFAADDGSSLGAHLMYSKLAAGLADDVSLTWLSGGLHLQGWGMVGGSITYLSQGEQIATEQETGRELGTFNSYQVALGVAYGARLSDNLGIGLGAKYFRDELAPDEFTKDEASGSGDTWAVDLGVHARVGGLFEDAGIDWLAGPLSGLSGGVTLANLGPDITFVDADQADPMPRTLRIGLAYDAWKSPLTSVTVIAEYLESLVSEDETKVPAVGVEWGYVSSLYLRAGYKWDTEGDIEDFTAGGGFDLERWTGQKLVFDYANIPQATDLDRVHRFSLSFDF